MNQNVLWSLRLGFSNKQSDQIQKFGLEKFLNKSINSKIDLKIPSFIRENPHTLDDLKKIRKQIKNADDKEKKELLKKQIYNLQELKKWWLSKIREEEFPLREKMTCFWHNHFVSTAQKVKVNYWVYQHNMVLRENAFGNFKDLTKKIIKTNAMVQYLDNVDNKKGALNENLSRELLELFTLGIGNYTENDIKNGAMALAGHTVGEEMAVYKKSIEVNESIEYFGKKGVFKVDDLIDIIFEQPNIPYFITKKLLQWFIYDTPEESLVQYYGDYFKKNNFEIQPLLTKIFTEEFTKNNLGSKIKDPLVYILQLIDELHIQSITDETILLFLKQQGMDLFNQPNVKGWDGGRSWLSSQIYLQRNKVSDLFCKGKAFNIKDINDSLNDTKVGLSNIEIQLKWNKNANNVEIIQSYTDRLLFQVDKELQNDMENILKYDFDSKDENAHEAVVRLFNYITKTPEYQII